MKEVAAGKAAISKPLCDSRWLEACSKKYHQPIMLGCQLAIANMIRGTQLKAILIIWKH